MVSRHPSIHYTVQGKGKPLILLHGIAGSLYQWERQIPALIRMGFQVYRPDLIGHGESYKPKDPQHYHLKEIYASLVDWISSLGLEQPYTLVGHSLGGNLCLQFSIEYPAQLNSMILIDPFYSPKQLSPAVNWLRQKPGLGVAALEQLSEKLFFRIVGWDPGLGGKFPPEIRHQLAVDLKRASPQILHILPSVADLTEKLGKIEIPILVVWGNRDLTLRPSSFPRLVSLLPNATGYRVMGCGHQPHISKPDLVNEVILDFLAQGSLPAANDSG